jgi:transposase-like protein
VTTWQDKPFVFVTLPTCPTCGSARRTTTRSVRDADGSVARRSRCRECGAKFTVVLGFPDIGRKTTDTR